MKKSLIALAALGAFAGSAMAQSSVTLFGVVDVAGTYIDNDVDSKYLLAQSGNSSSRIGFRGVEDLGGGLRAGFWLESALAPDDGSLPMDSRRRATVSLLGGWGEVRLGRDYTPTFWNWTLFDPFGTNGVGASTNLALETDQIPGNTFGTLVRANNTIGYHLPSMGGLYGQAMVAAGEGVGGNKFWGGRLGWASGPFNIAGAYGVTEANPATGVEFDNWNIAGSFNLSGIVLSAFYGAIEADNSIFDQTNWFIGASWPIGAWTIKGTYGAVERDACTVVAGCTGEGDQIAVGFTYDMSKRTALY
ncbi:MAG: porin, partial [Rubrivivax sp.]|nr:porin [Rubrivivax sp.]